MAALTTKAPEEFSDQIKMVRHSTQPRRALGSQGTNLDPWSSILYEEYLTPRYNLERNFQRAMPLLIPD